MAYNDISKNFTYENGGTIDGDLALTTMAANTKIKNTSSGQLYSKRSGFTNVFDKTNTYANYLKADEFGINTSGSGNGVASITYSTSGRKITQNLTTFTTPSDLATVNDNLKSQIDKVLPIGSYIQFSGSQAPAGFLVCNGSAVSRTTYSRLFAVIGTTYGSGNGSTTFNLPNLIDRFLQGSSTSGTVKNAGLPNITGTIYLGTIDWGSQSSSNGALSVQGHSDRGYSRGGTVDVTTHLGIDASKSSSIYGNSATVQPPALTCLICIKY